MIDFAMELFHEEAPPRPAPREPDEVKLRPGNGALAGAARTAASERDAADTDRQPAAPVPDPLTRAPGALPEPGATADTGATAPVTGRIEEVPADPARPVRDRLFEAAVLSLRTRPAPLPLRAVFVRFEAAPSVELESAVRAMVALFLRAPAKARAPMQAALTQALDAEAGTRFAVRLAVRLGGVFAPAPVPAPEPEPDAPSEDDP